MAFDPNQGLQGAAGGAAAGAALGPAGALVGAGIGGLLGGFGGDGGVPGFDQRQQGLQGAINQFGGPRDQGPSAGFLDIGQAQVGGFGGQFRGGQLDLISQLQAQSRGEGPSVAEKNRQLAQQDLLASQTAALATGGSRLGARGAAQNVQKGTQGLAGQAQVGRLQEQLNATGQLGGVLGQGRAQEIQASQFNANAINQRAFNQAQLESNRRQFNVGAGLQSQQLRDAQERFLRDLELRNALGQQQPGVGTQLLSGGGQVLGNAFAGGFFNQNGQQGGGGGGGQFNFQGAQLPGQTIGPSSGQFPSTGQQTLNKLNQ